MKEGKQDQYLCIVDPGSNTSTKWGRNDAVAKRLLTLSKDLQIVDQVYTVKNMLIDKGLLYDVKADEPEFEAEDIEEEEEMEVEE